MDLEDLFNRFYVNLQTSLIFYLMCHSNLACDRDGFVGRSRLSRIRGAKLVLYGKLKPIINSGMAKAELNGQTVSTGVYHTFEVEQNCVLHNELSENSGVMKELTLRRVPIYTQYLWNPNFPMSCVDEALIIEGNLLL